MKWSNKIDNNQPEIVKLFRKLGASVQHIHRVGQGCPDLAVGFRGKSYLFELKDGNKPPSQRKLTPDEEKWHIEWEGHVEIIESLDDVIDFMNRARLA